jgi:hypothetical protein
MATAVATARHIVRGAIFKASQLVKSAAGAAMVMGNAAIAIASC